MQTINVKHVRSDETGVTLAVYFNDNLLAVVSNEDFESSSASDCLELLHEMNKHKLIRLEVDEATNKRLPPLT